MNKGIVTSVSKSEKHTLTKSTLDRIRLLKGLGVEGDAHMGTTVKHRSRVAKDPNQPNLRQVHLIHNELLDELQSKGFDIHAGQMGENMNTHGIPLLDLPRGTLLHIGEKVIVEVTGLRTPCSQLDSLQEGLMKAVLDKDEEGNLIRKAGIMGIVRQGGDVHRGNDIKVELPPEPHEPLQPV